MPGIGTRFTAIKIKYIFATNIRSSISKTFDAAIKINSKIKGSIVAPNITNPSIALLDCKWETPTENPMNILSGTCANTKFGFNPSASAAT